MTAMTAVSAAQVAVVGPAAAPVAVLTVAPVMAAAVELAMAVEPVTAALARTRRSPAVPMTVVTMPS